MSTIPQHYLYLLFQLQLIKIIKLEPKLGNNAAELLKQITFCLIRIISFYIDDLGSSTVSTVDAG